jgi:hypothetical protein
LTEVTSLFSHLSFKKAAWLLVICFYFMVASMINVFPFLDGQHALLDFGSFYASGLKIQNGENPYNADSPYVLDIDFPLVGAGGKMINLNPPITAMIFAGISRFDPNQALKIWQAISAVLFTALVFVLTAEYRQNTTPAKFIWAFILAGFWQTLTLGQIYIVLLLFVIAGWIFLQRKSYILAGIAIGLVIAIKPNFVIWPIFLLVAGYHVTFLASLLTGALISFVPLLFYGVRVYQQWLKASSLHMGTLILPGNSSLIGLAARFHNITAGIVISIILVCSLLFLTKRKSYTGRIVSEQASALGIIASILASPISWVGYSLFLLPIFFSERKWTPALFISAAILSFPFAFVLKLWQDSPIEFVIFGWFYGWAILVLLGDVVKKTIITSSSQTN